MGGSFENNIFTHHLEDYFMLMFGLLGLLLFELLKNELLCGRGLSFYVPIISYFCQF